MADPTPPDVEETEAEYLARYTPGDWPRPSVTVDLVVLTILDQDLKVLLIRRKEHPCKGMLALPGGFLRVSDGLDQGEGLEAAAHRELAEETGLPDGSVWLKQLGAFGEPGRDPRLRVITVAWYALVQPDLAALVEAGSDAEEAGWHSLVELAREQLAFDHRQILDAAVARLEAEIEYTDVAYQLVPRRFSISELRGVYEVIQGQKLDPGNFRRRFTRLVEDGLIVEAPGQRITGRRPAKVYRFTGRR
jgi:8-oxo-dGTP diphosphatase